VSLPTTGKAEGTELMTGNITTVITPVKIEADLQALAEIARHHHQNVTTAAANMLDSAMAAGDALIAIENSRKVRHGEWTSWVPRNCGLNPRTAARYMQLARARPVLEPNRSRATDLSIAAALKLIAVKKDAAPKKNAKKPAKPAVVLSTLAWSDATLEQQRHFLDGINLDSVLAAAPSTWTLELFLKAIPPAWKTEIERRVDGQRKAKSRTPSEKIAAALQQALSAQKVHRDKNEPAPGVAAALNTINNLLIKEGADLNEIEITLNKNLTQAKRAA
jgi:hypothetical protein